MYQLLKLIEDPILKTVSNIKLLSILSDCIASTILEKDDVDTLRSHVLENLKLYSDQF